MRKDIRENLTRGDIVIVHELSFDGLRRIGNPYSGIVLLENSNGQPLITPINEYKPMFLRYRDIVEILGTVDLTQMINFAVNPETTDTTEPQCVSNKNETRKARLIIASTDQVSEYGYERHFRTIEADVSVPAQFTQISSNFDITKTDIVGGEWL